jgi:hypothetical protein
MDLAVVLCAEAQLDRPTLLGAIRILHHGRPIALLMRRLSRVICPFTQLTFNVLLVHLILLVH